MINFLNRMQDLMDGVQKLNFLAPLGLRIYLFFVFWTAANNKWNPFDSDSSLDGTIYWFTNSLELPLPTLQAYLAWSTEYFGAILLLIGFGVRWISIPLMFTMIVAAVAVHWDKGWQAVHDLASPHANEFAEAAATRLSRAKDILEEHGNYDWLTEHGNFVVSNNGIEWAATYFLMLLALFALGAGKYFSVDHWIKAKFRDVR